MRRHAAPDIGRTGPLGMAALLLVFVVVGRMVDVRVDTGGLLLINAAWAILLCSRSSRAVAAAAVLAGLALLFSARAAGMVVVLGLLLLYLAGRSRDWSAVRALFMVAGSFLAAGLALYLLAPEWVNLVIRACFLDPSKLLPGRVPLAARFLAPDRLPLTLLIAGGLLAGWKLLRSGAVERGTIVAAACGGQLLLIVLDPSPYQYVYGWAAVPAVLGIVSASRVGPCPSRSWSRRALSACRSPSASPGARHRRRVRTCA